MTTAPPDRLRIAFATIEDGDPAATTVILAGDGVAFGPHAKALDDQSGGQVSRAAGAAEFKGKAKASIEVLAPPVTAIDRLIVLGTGKEPGELDWLMLGGAALTAAGARKAKTASLIVDVAATGGLEAHAIAAAMALGADLRHYTFEKYRTKKPGTTNGNGNGNGNGTGNGGVPEATASDGEDAAPAKDRLEVLTIRCENPAEARKLYERHAAVAGGVHLARNLVNEPANALGPVEFAAEIVKLCDVGVEVEVLDEHQLADLGMGSLLAVAQGSARPARVCVMRWNGAPTRDTKPLAFIGKGVVFDTGGISIKPAQGMEDMKGDMGGAACVTGLMYALAARKAAVDAVGLVGLVENMPSGTAVRPGDIVTSMSGQTIEVLNTDAEGRLVLADVMHYAQERFQPRLMIDLATLTGAIMVALGKDHAGLFCNDDALVAQIQAASAATGEKVWRMPLDKSFDKLIESKTADIKNIGGRWGGACTAAAFLQRFVHKDMVWAHLDIAGTAMDAARTEINPSWGSGWGVRLLDRMVADHYEGVA